MLSSYIPQRQKLDLGTTQGLIGLAEQTGVSVPKTQKLSLWQRLGRGLTSFETGDALYSSMYEDKPFLKEYATNIAKGLGSLVTGKDYREDDPKKTFKDIMVIEGMRDRPGKIDAVDLAGLAGDIFTDPTTFLGSFIGKGIAKLGKTGVGIGKKIPVIGKGINVGEEAVSGLFKPFNKIEKLGEVGKAYRASFEQYAKGTRSATNDFLEQVSKRAMAVKKIPKAGEMITEAIEKKIPTGTKLLDDIVKEIEQSQKVFAKEEKARGILNAEIPDYMRHILTKEARGYMENGGNLAQFTKPIRVKLGAAKPRKLTGTIQDINKELKDKLGFNLFEPNAFKAYSQRGVENLQAVKTFDFLQTTAKRFGKTGTKPLIDETGTKWIPSTSPQLKGYVFPEAMSKHIDEFNNFLGNDEATNALLKTYDRIQNIWKGSVTGYFPAFHTRNALGGVFNNWIAGIKDPRIYITAEKVIKGGAGEITTKAGKKISFEEIRTMMKEYGVTGQTGRLDVLSYLENKVSPTKFTKIKEAPMQVMGAVENRLRSPLFIDGLKKGFTAEQAAKRVIKYHFDYMPEGFTAFEKNIMKRVFPFYTWTRHNIPLQIEQMIMQPGKYAAVFKTQRSTGLVPGTEEEKIMPTWLRERMSIKGGGGYWSGFGLPFEEMVEKVAKPSRGIGTTASPILRTPLELLTDYNIFKERSISEDTYGKLYKNSPEFFKQWLELKEHTAKDGDKYYTLNSHKKYWAEVIGARGLSTALRISNIEEDRKNIWSLITTIKKYNFDIDDLKEFSDTELRQDIEKKLINAGVLREFKINYQPK